MPNIHETIKQLSIEAGGPGSGRHPGFGKFKRIKPPKNDLTDTDYWKHKDTTVSATDTPYPGPLPVKTTIKENGTVVHRSANKSSDFLKKRYGIDDGVF